MGWSPVFLNWGVKEREVEFLNEGLKAVDKDRTYGVCEIKEKRFFFCLFLFL